MRGWCCGGWPPGTRTATRSRSPTWSARPPSCSSGGKGARSPRSSWAARCPAAPSPPRTPRSGAALLASAKNTEEHAYAVASMRDVLAPLCTSLGDPVPPLAAEAGQPAPSGHRRTRHAGGGPSVLSLAGRGAPTRRGVRDAGRDRAGADPRAGADGAGPVRRAGRLGGRSGQRRVRHRAAVRRAGPAAGPGCSPAAASWPVRTRWPRWPRPRSSSCPCARRWRADRRRGGGRLLEPGPQLRGGGPAGLQLHHPQPGSGQRAGQLTWVDDPLVRQPGRRGQAPHVGAVRGAEDPLERPGERRLFEQWRRCRRRRC